MNNGNERPCKTVPADCSPFGPGAMHTDRFGVSVICCGLDHWFDESDENAVEEFKINDEWRVKRELGVDHLRLPPDYRRTQSVFEVPNAGRTIPFLRFPTWHYCTICGRDGKKRHFHTGARGSPEDMPDLPGAKNQPKILWYRSVL